MSTAKGKGKSKTKPKSESNCAMDENEEISQLRTQLEIERAVSATLRETANRQKRQLKHQQRMIIEEQRMTLATVRKDLKVTEEQLKRLAIQKQSASPFLKKLPVEIRIKIYKLLLVNSELGESSSIGKDAKFGFTKKFELSPQILRTCRAINAEAGPILYGSNTFVMECIGAHGPGGVHVPQSPLTRNVCTTYMGTGVEHDFDFATDRFFRCFKKVKHWKIITTSYRPTPNDPVPSRLFVHFCQALCRRSSESDPLQRSIEIVVALAKDPSHIPTPASSGPPDAVDQYYFSKKQMEYLIEPLKLLKEIGIEHITLRLAKKEDMPTPADCLCMKPKYYFPEMESNTKEESDDSGKETFDFEQLADDVVEEYEEVVEAGSPVEMVYEMHQRLMTYALTFERALHFRCDMQTLHRDHGVEPELRHFGWFLPKPSHGNPFRSYDVIHPVERALSQAIIANDREDVPKFKEARATVIKQLEPQYKRIVEAAEKLRTFVAEESGQGMFAECSGCRRYHHYDEDWEDQGDLDADVDRYIYTLSKIATMFDRSMPQAMKIKVDKGVTMYEASCTELFREQLFVNLRWMQKQDTIEKDPRQTAQWIKALVEDMYEQYIEIREARIALFDKDITARKCKIDLQEELDADIEDVDFGAEVDEEYLSDEEMDDFGPQGCLHQ